jgi:uncharacterized membrane protein YsdA (DUF1294 family)
MSAIAPPIAVRLAVAALLLAALLITMSLGRAPVWLLWLYLVVSIASAIAYGLDKRAAGAGSWRIAESTLLGIDLVGGIVGGLLAQVAFRHKTSKPSFGTATFAIAVLHLLALAWLLALT